MVDRNIGFTSIAADLLDASDGTGQHTMVRTGTNGATIYQFYVDAAADLGYKKSTDSGKTWGSFVVIEGTDAYIGVSVWFDRWTIGDTTGNTIHIFATDSTNKELTYFSLGIDDDLAEAVAFDDYGVASGYQSVGSIALDEMQGNLVGYTATAHATQAGWNFFKSDDSGGTWALKNSDGNPAQFLNDKSDLALLMPLNTDDDILLIGVDTTLEVIYSCVYDNSTSDTWETAVRILTQFIISLDEATGSTQLSCAYDHSNADCFIMFENDENSIDLCNTVTMFYDESTRAVAFDDYGVASGYQSVGSIALDEMQGNLVGRQIIRNSDTGQLIIMGFSGDQTTQVIAGYQVSNDNGRHWSDIMHDLAYESSVNTSIEDFRKMNCPPFTDTDSGVQFVRFDDDDQDIECLKYPLTLYAAQTGNCKDDAGTNDEGVTVKMFMEPLTHYGWRPESSVSFVGQDITDASGNWSIAPPPTGYLYNVGGERNFYLTYYDDKGDIKTPVMMKWRMDRDDWGTKAGTQVAYDTGNDEIDFATAQSALDQHIRVLTPFGLVGNFNLKWAIDFDLRIDTLTQGASGVDNDLFIMLLSVNSGMNGSGIGFGLRLVVSSTENQYDVIFTETEFPMTVTAKSTFAHTPVAETLYVRMGMKSKDILSIAFYSDAARTSLIEEETFDVSGIGLTQSFLSANKYIYIAMDDSSSADSTINGAISNVRFYAVGTDEVVSADTGSDTDLTDLSHVEGQV